MTTIPETPPWTRNRFKEVDDSPSARAPGAISSHFLERPGLFLASYCLSGALHLEESAFERACYQLYRHLADELAVRSARYPVRLWNFIPGILEPLGDLEHRYMVFNAGRFRALRDWLGADAMPSQVATASGVGHFGEDLWLHCLASDRPGQPVENPRQTPAYNYSAKYGPLPPCFARATRWTLDDEPPWLLVGGTASVRGEESCHEEDLRRQLDETLYNLAAVVRAGHGNVCPSLSPEDVRDALRRYQELRIYIVEPEMEAAITEKLRYVLPLETELEFVHAELCRPELLVEIEGIAALAR